MHHEHPAQIRGRGMVIPKLIAYRPQNQRVRNHVFYMPKANAIGLTALPNMIQHLRKQEQRRPKRPRRGKLNPHSTKRTPRHQMWVKMKTCRCSKRVSFFLKKGQIARTVTFTPLHATKYVMVYLMRRMSREQPTWERNDIRTGREEKIKNWTEGFGPEISGYGPSTASIQKLLNPMNVQQAKLG